MPSAVNPLLDHPERAGHADAFDTIAGEVDDRSVPEVADDVTSTNLNSAML
jgi:hypothetical protein